MELVLAHNGPGLEQLAAAEPRALRPLLGRLWDEDHPRRQMVARALAVGAAAHPTLGVEIVRRLLWALNDEAATNGVYGVAALGEIGARCPELMEPFVGPLSSWARDDGLRPEILRALARIAESAPRLVQPHLEGIRRLVDTADPEEARLLAEVERIMEEATETR